MLSDKSETRQAIQHMIQFLTFWKIQNYKDEDLDQWLPGFEGKFDDK